MAGKEWTDEEIEQYRRLYNEGLSMRQVSIQIGRPPESVRDRIYRDIEAGVLKKQAGKPKRPKPSAPKRSKSLSLSVEGPERGRGRPAKKRTVYKGNRQVCFLSNRTYRFLRVTAAMRQASVSEIIEEALIWHFIKNPVSPDDFRTTIDDSEDNWESTRGLIWEDVDRNPRRYGVKPKK